MNEVIKLLVSMKIRIRRLKKNKVNRCGRMSNLERKISIRRKRRSKNVFEMEEISFQLIEELSFSAMREKKAQEVQENPKKKKVEA